MVLSNGGALSSVFPPGGSLEKTEIYVIFTFLSKLLILLLYPYEIIYRNTRKLLVQCDRTIGLTGLPHCGNHPDSEVWFSRGLFPEENSHPAIA